MATRIEIIKDYRDIPDALHRRATFEHLSCHATCYVSSHEYVVWSPHDGETLVYDLTTNRVTAFDPSNVSPHVEKMLRTEFAIPDEWTS